MDAALVDAQRLVEAALNDENFELNDNHINAVTNALQLARFPCFRHKHQCRVSISPFPPSLYPIYR